MNTSIDNKHNTNVVFMGMIVLASFLLHSFANHAHATREDDIRLAEKFAPIFVLTENPTTDGRDYAVIFPEPVEIVGADSLSNVQVISSSEREVIRPNPANPDEIISQIIPRRHYRGSITSAPSEIRDFVSDIFNVNFDLNKFAFLEGYDELEFYPPSSGGPLTIYMGTYFDYPGDDPDSWYDAYSPERNADDTHAGWRFPNTVYAHVFDRDSSDNYGSVVIKYYCFYPFNHWVNNHEGDWPRVNVMVTSRNPDEARIHGVDYTFHGQGITYYNITNHPSKHNVKRTIAPVGSQYPVVYVSAGGHGHFPTPGHYEDAGRVNFHEDLTPYGVVLHPKIVDSDANKDIAQSYELVLLPEPVNTLDNRGLDPEMSWLGADVRWGTPRVDSLPFSDNKAPPGPLYSSWDRIRYDNSDRDDYLTNRIPHNNFHNFPIVGDVSWNGTISLFGDIVVFPGATLTIEPGTIIEFGAGVDSHKFPAQGHGEDDLAEIFVYGTLNAEGESTNPIHFRKDSRPGYQGVNTWGGIRIMPGGSRTLNYTSISDMSPPPTPPTDLTAQVGDGGVTLEWVLPEVEDPTITGWAYRAGTISGADTTWADWQNVGVVATTSHLVEDLINGTKYTFQVAAVNSAGRGSASDPSAAVTAAGPPEPPELTVAAGHERVRVRWSSGADNGSEITGHKWRYKAGAAAWDPDWTVYRTPEQIIRNLDNDTTYTFQMKSKNGVGYSEVVEVQATPRHPIEGLTTISFAENSDDSVASYRFAPAELDQSLVDYRLHLSDVAVFDSGLFELNSQGELRFGDAPDFEAPTDADGNNIYTVRLRAAPVSGNGDPVRRTAPPLPFIKQVEVTVENADDPGVIELSPLPPQVGVPFTAELTDQDGGISGARWQWQGQEPGTMTWTPLSTASGATRSSYTPQVAQVGWTLRAVVNPYRDVFGAGKTAQSDPSALVQAGVPTAPENLTLVAGDQSMQLTWEAPRSDGGSAITGYTYRYSPDGGTTWLPSADGTTLDATTFYVRDAINELINGTEYTFEVWANNERGAGAVAQEKATPGVVPPQPTDLLSATAGLNQITVSWDEVSAVPEVTGYKLQYRSAEVGTENWSAYLPATTTGPRKRSYTHREYGTVSVGYRFQYQLKALNAIGEGAWSDRFPAAGAIPRPGHDAAIDSLAVDNENVTVRWECPNYQWCDPLDGASVAPLTLQARKQSGSGAWTDWVGVPSSQKTTVTHSVSSLDQALVHRFQTQAVNANGDLGIGSEWAVVVPLRAQAGAAAGTVQLGWDAPGRSIDGWQYRFKSGSGSWGAWQAVPESDRTTLSHAVPSLTDGVSYQFQVQAMHRGKVKVVSFIQSAPPQPPETEYAYRAWQSAPLFDAVASGTPDNWSSSIITWTDAAPRVWRIQRTRPSGGLWSAWGTLKEYSERPVAQPDPFYRQAASQPDTPGNTTSSATPTNWLTSNPGATATQGVWRTERTRPAGETHYRFSTPTQITPPQPGETEYAYRASQSAPLFDAVASGTPDNWSSSIITWTDAAPRVWRIQRTRPSGGLWSAWGTLKEYSERPATSATFYQRAISAPSTPGTQTDTNIATPSDWQTTQPTATATESVWSTTANRAAGDTQWIFTAPTEETPPGTETEYAYRASQTAPLFDAVASGTPDNWSSGELTWTDAAPRVWSIQRTRPSGGTWSEWGTLEKHRERPAAYETFYRRASSAPSTPGTQTGTNLSTPSTWQTTPPTATATQGVWSTTANRAAGDTQWIFTAPTQETPPGTETQYAYRAWQTAPLFDAVASGTPDNWSSGELTWTDAAPRVWSIQRTRPSGGIWSEWGNLEKYRERPAPQLVFFYRRAVNNPGAPLSTTASATPSNWETSNPGATTTLNVWQTQRSRPLGDTHYQFTTPRISAFATGTQPPETQYAYRASQAAPLFDAVASGTPDNWSSGELTWTDAAPRVWSIQRTRPSGGTWSEWGTLEKHRERPAAYETFYRRASSAPSTPGTQTGTNLSTPSTWQTTPPTATATQGVWSTTANRAAGDTQWVFTVPTQETPPTSGTAPGLPRNFDADTGSPLTAGSIDLDWDAPTRGGTPTGYRVEYRFSSGSWLLGATPTLTNVSLILPRAGALYQFHVRAENSAGNSGWVETTGTTSGQAQPPETEYAYRLHTSGTTAPTFTASASTVPTGWYSSSQTPHTHARYEWRISRSRPAGGSWSSWGSASVVSRYTETQTAYKRNDSGTTAPAFSSTASGTPYGWSSSQPSPTSSNRYVWSISRTRPAGGSWSSWGSASVVSRYTERQTAYKRNDSGTTAPAFSSTASGTPYGWSSSQPSPTSSNRYVWSISRTRPAGGSWSSWGSASVVSRYTERQTAYQRNDSGTTAPAFSSTASGTPYGWSSSQPSPTSSNRYVWSISRSRPAGGSWSSWGSASVVSRYTERQTAYQRNDSGTTAPAFSATASGTPYGWSSSQPSPTSSNRYVWSISRSRPAGGSWSSWGSASVVSRYTERQTAYQRNDSGTTAPAFSSTASGTPYGWSSSQPSPTSSNRYVWSISRSRPAGGSWSSWGSASVVARYTERQTAYKRNDSGTTAPAFSSTASGTPYGWSSSQPSPTSSNRYVWSISRTRPAGGSWSSWGSATVVSRYTERQTAYQRNDSGTTAPAFSSTASGTPYGWSSSQPSPTSSNRYVWSISRSRPAGGSWSSWGSASVVSRYTETQTAYKRNDSGTTAPAFSSTASGTPYGWSSSQPSPTSSNRYVWSISRTRPAGGSWSSWGSATVVSRYTERQTAYQRNDSGTTAPAFSSTASGTPYGWSSSQPSPTSSNRYVWSISRSRPAGGSWSSWGSASVVSRYTERQTAYRLHTSGTTAPSFSATASGVPSGWSSTRPSPDPYARYVWQISRTRPTGGSWSNWGSATVVSRYTERQTAYQRNDSGTTAPAFSSTASGTPYGWSSSQPSPTSSNRYVWSISRSRPAGGSWSSWGSATVVSRYTERQTAYQRNDSGTTAPAFSSTASGTPYGWSSSQPSPTSSNRYVWSISRSRPAGGSWSSWGSATVVSRYTERQTAYQRNDSGTTAPAFSSTASGTPYGWSSSQPSPTSSNRYVWSISRSRPAGGSWSSWGSASVVSRYTERQTAYRLHTSGTTAPSFSATASGVPSGWSSTRPSPDPYARYVWQISRTRPTGGSWSNWGSATVVSTYTAYRRNDSGATPPAFSTIASGVPSGGSWSRLTRAKAGGAASPRRQPSILCGPAPSLRPPIAG